MASRSTRRITSRLWQSRRRASKIRPAAPISRSNAPSRTAWIRDWTAPFALPPGFGVACCRLVGDAGQRDQTGRFEAVDDRVEFAGTCERRQVGQTPSPVQQDQDAPLGGGQIQRACGDLGRAGLGFREYEARVEVT